MMDKYSGAGCYWTVLDNTGGGANVTVFPKAASAAYRLGTGDASAAASELRGARAVAIVGYTILVPAVGKNISFTNHSKTPIEGLTFKADVAGTFAIGNPGEGVLYSTLTTISTASNLGLLCEPGVHAVMYWRKIA